MKQKGQLSQWQQRQSDLQREWRKNNPEKMKEYARKRKADPAKAAQDKAAVAAWYQDHKTERANYMREYMRKRRQALKEA